MGRTEDQGYAVEDRLENVLQIRVLMNDQRFAVLSTSHADGHPYANLVAFCFSQDLKHLFFCTLRSTRKFENLAHDPRIAMLIDNRCNDETDLEKATAVTVLGSCRETQGEHRSALASQFLERHPSMADFVKSPDCALMEEKVFSYYLVTRFQHVIELKLQD